MLIIDLALSFTTACIVFVAVSLLATLLQCETAQLYATIAGAVAFLASFVALAMVQVGGDRG